MDKTTLRALASKRVGGIPIMVIAAVVAGAILFLVYRRTKGSSTDTADTSSDSTPTGDTGPDDSTQQPVFQAVTSVSTPPESDTDDGTGQTPTPVPPKSTPSPPASKQGEPPLQHTVMGNRDNTPAELARLYYGTNSSDATDKIKAANDTVLPPYRVGSKVHIPEKYEPKYFDATAHIDTEYEIARRNNTTADKILALNPHLHFPVKAGTRVRVH